MYGANQPAFAAYVVDGSPIQTDSSLMATDANTLVAIVDDDPLVRSSMANLMRSLGYGAAQFPNAPAFLAQDLGRFSCVITDMQMPLMSGLDMQAQLLLRAPDLRLLFMTAFPDEWARTLALARGARGYFEKPCDVEQLIAVVADATGGPDAGARC